MFDERERRARAEATAGIYKASRIRARRLLCDRTAIDRRPCGRKTKAAEGPRVYAAVIIRTLLESPRSRAAGVTIVFGLMKIFCCLVMATRMSFSLTKSAILISGVGGLGNGDGIASGLNCGFVDCWVGFGEVCGFAGVVAAFGDSPKCSATAAAATSAGVG